MRKGFVRVTAFLLLICMIIAAGGAMRTVASASTSASAMLVLERDSGRVLYSHNADAKRPMASTTKIVTAITVIDHTPELDKTINVPAAAVGVEGSSIYLQANEPLTIRDLLYGLMLQSGNDCAAALAILTAGSEEKFSALMNETARKAGAANSNFITPHGLHHDEHYTTAYDLALISAYAMKNPVFAEIVSSKIYTMPWQGREYKRIIKNKNRLLSSFEGADGIKTGFTKKAGRCLVSSATRGGMTVIAVVLNCGPMFEECASLMQRAFNEYDLYDVGSAARVPVMVDDGVSPSVTLMPKGELSYPLTESELKSLRYRYSETVSMKSPVERGTKNGKVDIFLENQLLFSSDLYTIDSVEG